MIDESYTLSRVATGDMNPVKELMMMEMKKALPNTSFTVRFEWEYQVAGDDTYITLRAFVQRLVVHPEDELTG